MSTEDNATLSKLSDLGKTVADTEVDVRGLTVTDKNGTYNRSVYGHYGYAPFWEAAYAHPYYPMSLPHA
jgi:hypothetical protein